MTLMEVVWYDAESFADSEWTTMDDINEWAEKPLLKVTSVGQLIHEAKDYLVLLATRAEDSGFHAIKIPKLWIESQRRL